MTEDKMAFVLTDRRKTKISVKALLKGGIANYNPLNSKFVDKT